MHSKFFIFFTIIRRFFSPATMHGPSDNITKNLVHRTVNLRHQIMYIHARAHSRIKWQSVTENTCIHVAKCMNMHCTDHQFDRVAPEHVWLLFHPHVPHSTCTVVCISYCQHTKRCEQKSPEWYLPKLVSCTCVWQMCLASVSASKRCFSA